MLRLQRPVKALQAVKQPHRVPSGTRWGSIMMGYSLNIGSGPQKINIQFNRARDESLPWV